MFACEERIQADIPPYETSMPTTMFPIPGQAYYIAGLNEI